MLSRIVKTRNILILNQSRFFGPKATKPATVKKPTKSATKSVKKESAAKPETPTKASPKPVQAAKTKITPMQSAEEVPIQVRVIHNIVQVTVALPSKGPLKFFVNLDQNINKFLLMLQTEDSSIESISASVS